MDFSKNFNIPKPQEPTLYMGIGIPGSGKSTFLKELEVEFDIARIALMIYVSSFYATIITMNLTKIFGS